MSSCPGSCHECTFDRSCTSGMYMEGCAFYGPNDRPKSFTEQLKNFFNKIFG